MIAGCEIPEYHGDNFCDDENNNVACFFDGGDCCGSNVNTQYCTECQCLGGGGGGGGGTTTSSGTTTVVGCNQGWIGDGYCDDINNNLDCTYDGGDCCGDYVYEDYCDECLCLEWVLIHNVYVLNNFYYVDWFLLCSLHLYYMYFVH